MSIRKFGTGPDQKVVADEKDTQGVRKEASRRLTEDDRQKLAQENKDK
jgi:hypothetical protein